MSVGEYAKLAGLRARLFGPSAGSSDNDALLAEICGEVNDFIESTAQRVLAPVPTFSATVSGTLGQSSITLSTALGAAVGDDLLLGPVSGDHEAATILAIAANLSQDADEWASASEYGLGDIVQPTEPTGHTYRCVGAGTSGEEEPTWPTDGNAIGDGTAIWLDLGLTDATVRVRLPLAFDHVDDVCQRILVADGVDAVEHGRCLIVPVGILTLAALELASGETRAFRVIDPIDWFLQPGRASLRPGWPQTELWLNQRAYPKAWRNVRLIGPGPCVDMDDEPALGFPRIPDVIRTVAYNVAATRWQMRASGGAYDVAVGSDQVQVGSFILSRTDWTILQDHARGWTIS